MSTITGRLMSQICLYVYSSCFSAKCTVTALSKALQTINNNLLINSVVETVCNLMPERNFPTDRSRIAIYRNAF